MSNFSMFSNPNFWSWLLLLMYVMWLQAQCRKMRREVAELTAVSEKDRGDIIGKAGLGDYMSATADVTIHHGCELTRVRESLLELATDLYRISQTTAALSGWPGHELDNRVFARHTALPGEFPLDVQQGYLSGGWICPKCGSQMDHNWSWWCNICQHRTFPGLGSSGKIRSSSPEHELTQPGGICTEDEQSFTPAEPPTSPNGRKRS